MGIPADIAQRIKQLAAVEWPNDFAMQVHRIDSQREAYEKIFQYKSKLDLDNEVIKTCFLKAETDWPDDFEMQVHVFDGQINAASEFFEVTIHDIPSDIVEGIRVRSFQEWPGDYEMMLHEFNTQVEAYRALGAR
ncbi:hypothetical protein OIU35_27105 [Boseaceae bacterium BT-24-1]|nr:hypothetical protein [Boseaceae bacterium BT-24-1]